MHIVRVAGRVRSEGVHVVSAAPDPGRTSLPELQRQIGVQFADEGLLRTALTHSSYANEYPDDAPETNERLEFSAMPRWASWSRRASTRATRRRPRGS